MDKKNMSPEAELIYESAKTAVARVRTTFLLVSTCIGLGCFYLFLWYASWDLTRIEGRRAVAAEIRRVNKTGHTFTDSADKDREIADRIEKKADELEEEHGNHDFEVPLTRLRVSSADFPVAFLVITTGLLLWLLFYIRRLNECLACLRMEQGRALVALLLRFQFVLIGKKASRPIQLIARCLPPALTFIAVSLWISDCLDLYGFWRDPIKRLVFTSYAYEGRVAFRLVLELVLAYLLSYFGAKCYKEVLRSEDELIGFDEE